MGWRIEKIIYSLFMCIIIYSFKHLSFQVFFFRETTKRRWFYSLRGVKLFFRRSFLQLCTNYRTRSLFETITDKYTVSMSLRKQEKLVVNYRCTDILWHHILTLSNGPLNYSTFTDHRHRTMHLTMF